MSAAAADPSIAAYFAALEDPRVDRTKRHPLLTIVGIALCAVVCGADAWVEVAAFGEARRDWLAGWLDLGAGVPSHDTFGRVFAALDPAQFEACFAAWVQAVARATGGQLVAIDGKVLRGSHDRAAGRGALDLVAVEAGSNEIPAIPALLRLLAPEGCVVTVDAIGCQAAIAQAVRAQGADYVLALKENQPALHRGVAEAFAELDASAGRAYRHDRCRQVDKGHGRLEVRQTTVITDPALLAYLDPAGAWAGLGCLVRVGAQRRVGAERSAETRYYLSSLAAPARLLHAAVRGHWGIENSVHWVLDMAFREDLSRVRAGHAAHNFSLLRRLALNLLRQDARARCGIKARRLQAACDPAYLVTVLNGSF